MKKTLNRDNKELLTVNADTLAGMLNCGRATAVKIGTDSGAKIQIGRRTLYKVSIIEEYLNAIAGE
ncbi:MAG: hypothetical protein K1W16_00290 [Lachnospiraceae bacterium]